MVRMQMKDTNGWAVSVEEPARRSHDQERRDNRAEFKQTYHINISYLYCITFETGRGSNPLIEQKNHVVIITRRIIIKMHAAVSQKVTEYACLPV